jgi:hypothetical protein
MKPKAHVQLVRPGSWEPGNIFPNGDNDDNDDVKFIVLWTYPSMAALLENTNGGTKVQGESRESLSSPPPSPAAMSVATWDSVKDLEHHEGLEFENESLGLNIDFFQYTMVFLMFTAGFLDIVATVLPAYWKDDIDDDRMVGSYSDFDNLRFVQTTAVQDVVRWLEYHDVTITFWFSAMWFLDSFIEANRRFRMVQEKLERQRLLGSNEKETLQFWERPIVVYWWTVVFQVLLLPVGFYFLFYCAVDQILHFEKVGNLEEIEECPVVQFVDLNGVDHVTRSYSAETKMALLFAVLQHAWLRLTSKAVRMARAKMVQKVKSKLPSLAMNAVRHPKRFRNKIKTTLAAVRWLKYLAPLIGTSLKLNDNVQDMMKKWRQTREAVKYKKVRKVLWERKTAEVQMEDAAIMLQSVYRSWQVRKRIHAIKLVTLDKEYFAALKVQRVLRRKLVEARERISAKKMELEHLEKLRDRNNSRLTDADKKRMYELQDELASDAEALLNHKLLLRPNTKFALIWKIIFVTCVVLEITELAVKPWIEDYKEKTTKVPMTIEEFVAQLVIPKKMSERPECHATKPGFLKAILKFHGGEDEKEIAWYCHWPVSGIHEVTREMIALSISPTPVAEWPECRVHPKKSFVGRVLHINSSEPRPRGWYCHPAYTKLHCLYRKVLEFIVKEFFLIVGIICYMDVFIFFFTGDIHPETGVKIPKPFFTRWIFPGLLFQCLVNPVMGSTAGAMWSSIKTLIHLGAVRVWRWYVAVVFPLGYALVSLGMQYLWVPFAAYENSKKIEKLASWTASAKTTIRTNFIMSMVSPNPIGQVNGRNEKAFFQSHSSRRPPPRYKKLPPSHQSLSAGK